MNASDHYAEAQRHLDEAAKHLQRAAGLIGSPYKVPTTSAIADVIYARGRVDRLVLVLGAAEKGRR